MDLSCMFGVIMLVVFLIGLLVLVIWFTSPAITTTDESTTTESEAQ